MQVDAPNNEEIYSKSGVSEGQFVFTTKTAGEYRACFTVPGAARSGARPLGSRALCHAPASVSGRINAVECRHCALRRTDLQTAYHTKIKLDWRTGVAATDWNSIAKKEHLDALSVELRKLEDNIRCVKGGARPARRSHRRRSRGFACT